MIFGAPLVYLSIKYLELVRRANFESNELILIKLKKRRKRERERGWTRGGGGYVLNIRHPLGEIIKPAIEIKQSQMKPLQLRDDVPHMGKDVGSIGVHLLSQPSDEIGYQYMPQHQHYTVHTGWGFHVLS